MTNYRASELVLMEEEKIDELQKFNDRKALEYINSKSDDMFFLSDDDKERLKENFSQTMDKVRLLYEGIVSVFQTEHTPGFPEAIYNIDLRDGSIEADKNGRPICYSTEVLAPCSMAMLKYVNRESNDVFIVFPPIKSVERTVEKTISECLREYNEVRDENLRKFEESGLKNEYDELPGGFWNDKKTFEDLVWKKQPENNDVKGCLLNIANKDILPRDIYRLTVTSRYPSDLEYMIKEFSEKFPDYIQFEEGERNSYKKKLSENERNYFDIKKIAKIKIPESDRSFYIEFQFKQTNMFFAHIRSHQAYEEYRVLHADRLDLEEEIAKKKKDDKESKIRLNQLKKKEELKKNSCLTIHANAVHQSNLYILYKLLWLENNAKGLRRKPDSAGGRYKYLEDMLKRDYIVESYVPFDGENAFKTSSEEYLNKAYYLKAIGILPESFNEIGKNAKEKVFKTWNNLAPADIKDFNRITEVAVKYQPVIRKLQHDRHVVDQKTLLKVMADADFDR